MPRQLLKVTIIVILLACLLGNVEAKDDFEKISDDKYKLPKKEAVNTTIEFKLRNDTTVIDPSIFLDIWDGESKLIITFNSDNAKINHDKDKIKEKKLSWELEDYILDIETVDPDDITKTGGIEFNLTLDKKPITNVFLFPIATQNLSFYYQPALTPEEIAKGEVRSDNVTGSYAVYHTSKRHNEYKTGKAFHIYRPKAIDDNGDWIWGNMSIGNGNLTIELNQDWLDKAKYPVILDPIIGYDVLEQVLLLKVTTLYLHIKKQSLNLVM